MALAGAPSPGDAIIGNHESLVFLSADASLRLSGQTLQASDPVERPSFFLS
jgi:hypothetical protein